MLEFFAFLATLFTNGEALLLLAAWVGVVAHYLSKHARGEITGSLWHYIVSDPFYTLATLFAIFAACLAIVATGQIEGMARHMIFALGFTTGWTLDSGIAPGKPGPAPVSDES